MGEKLQSAHKMPLPPGLLLLLLSGATATAALPLEGGPTGRDSEVSTVPTWPHASPLSVSCWLFGLHGECVCVHVCCTSQLGQDTGLNFVVFLAGPRYWDAAFGPLILSYMSQPMKPAGNLCSSRRALRRVSGKGEASVPVHCRAGVELRQPFQSLQLYIAQAPTGSE